jgi:hypothetical protein
LNPEKARADPFGSALHLFAEATKVVSVNNNRENGVSEQCEFLNICRMPCRGRNVAMVKVWHGPPAGVKTGKPISPYKARQIPAIVIPVPGAGQPLQ